MRPLQTSAIVSSRSNACLIRSQVTARMFGSSSIKVEPANSELAVSGAMVGPRTTNWPLLLFTVRTPPGSAARPVQAISEPRMIASVLIVVCGSVPDGIGWKSTPLHVPSDFALAGFDSGFGAGFGAGFVSDFGAGLASPPVEAVAG